jgi:acid phosphatase type 7
MWVTPFNTGSVVLLQDTSIPNPATQTFNGTSKTYSVDSYTSGAIHTVRATGLKPNTRYTYMVGDPNAGFSTQASFITAPDTNIPVTIGVVGDVGTTTNSQTTIAGLVADPDSPSIVVHAGDLSYANGYQPIWDTFGHLIEPMASKVPWMVGVGNHENYYNFTAFFNRYTMPAAPNAGGNLYFAFSYSYVQFIWLSTESDYSAQSAQFQWFKSALAAVDRTKTPWLVVVWHRPYYCSNTAHHGEADQFKTIYEDLLYQNKVDLVINGHVHAYERTKPVYHYYVHDDFPTVYITIGDGGNQEGLATQWYSQPDWSAFRRAAYGYGKMQVSNATHMHWTWMVNNGQFFSATEGDSTWFVRPFPRA